MQLRVKFFNTYGHLQFSNPALHVGAGHFSQRTQLFGCQDGRGDKYDKC